MTSCERGSRVSPLLTKWTLLKLLFTLSLIMFIHPTIYIPKHTNTSLWLQPTYLVIWDLMGFCAGKIQLQNMCTTCLFGKWTLYISLTLSIPVQVCCFVDVAVWPCFYSETSKMWQRAKVALPHPPLPQFWYFKAVSVIQIYIPISPSIC